MRLLRAAGCPGAMTATGSRLKGLHCQGCGADLDAAQPVGTCPACGSALLAVYDLDSIAAREWWRSLSARPASLWRFRELLPVQDDSQIATLGEGVSAILDLGRPPETGDLQVLLKDDGGLPTGSFKARGMTVAVSRAHELGLSSLFVPSAGNAGVALAAYAARARIKARIYLPEGTPTPMQRACARYGAGVVTVPGTIRDAGERARREEAGRGSFDVSTLREPYRAEGKKTMGLEIVETLGTEGMPDAVVYPAGGGTGLIGMHRAFEQLQALGLLDRAPRLLAVQPEGCAPLVRALRDGAPRATPWETPHTIAPGLLVPSPFASDQVLEAVRATRGGGTTVSDEAILEAVDTIGRRYGVSVSPEGAAPFAALPGLLREGKLRAGERVLLYNTGSGIPFL